MGVGLKASQDMTVVYVCVQIYVESAFWSWKWEVLMVTPPELWRLKAFYGYLGLSIMEVSCSF